MRVASRMVRWLLRLAIGIAIVLFVRIACQKMYALSQGYKAEFKVWWAGLAICLVVVFISYGKVASGKVQNP